MSTHQLDLLENALDSLAEALAKFKEGEAGDSKAYKFAVLHMAHFIELIFKHHVAEKHPLLLYKDPFAKKLDTAKTIGLWDAVNFIGNETDASISAELRKDLEWVKDLRNQIEHHKFVMDVPQVRITLGRLFRSVLEFLEEHGDVDVEAEIPEATLGTFRQLADEYEFRRQDAIKEADAIEEADAADPSDPDVEPVRLGCPACDNPTLVKDAKSPSGYECIFCGNQESDDIPAYCDICGVHTTQGELDVWPPDDEHGEPEYRCYYCSGRYHADKDD
jgi:uncharacterized protein YutE (UPF0331/DUF86 family)